MVIYIVIKFFESSNQVTERLHQERCNSHAKEQDESADQPLLVRSRGVVSKTYSRQRSEEEVCHSDRLIQDRFGFDVVVV